MGEWIIGAIINFIGSISINFGTNLLKLGHDERDKLTVSNSSSNGGKHAAQSIIHFRAWRTGLLIFALGNCLNFISFSYAAQSLLAALGSVQFISNIAFTYFVLKKTVSGRIIIATVFIVLGNLFLVTFGNHQSPVYTPEQLVEKYNNPVFLVYVLILVLIVAMAQYTYRRGELLHSVFGLDLNPYWAILLPFTYATVSGAIGSCSVLFAKSLSNLLRLAVGSSYKLHSWFTYSMLLLFFSTAGFWMARLNEGLGLFDAILIVPMFQIAWTFFSICTGFVYFQEYQVFNSLRTSMFVLGMVAVFLGISLLAPEEPRGTEEKESLMGSTSNSTSVADKQLIFSEDSGVDDGGSFKHAMLTRATSIVVRTKNACTLSLGFSEDQITASAVIAMPMLSSRITGFRGQSHDGAKLYALGSPRWNKTTKSNEPAQEETSSLLSQSGNTR